ncbi:relaxase/mobilization nuclease domain-containing protein, partial [Paracoccus fontiphilus]
KAAAGVKNTGRKSTRGPVFAFSLAWHPSEAEGLDRAEMTRAADHALKVLALDHLQAVIIAHHDTAHPHVHVVVNRIDPTNGKATSIDGVKVKKLDAWANDYEQRRGQIVSPNRAKKYDQIKAGQNAHPDPEKRRRYIEDKKRQRAEAQQRPAQQRTTEQRPPSRGQILKDLSDAQKAQHKQDWKDWGAKAKDSRKAIYDRADMARAAALEAFKQATRKDWAQHFKAERDRARAFESRERSFSGIVQNALAAAKQQFREGPQGGRGLLGQTFANVLDGAARRQAFSQAQEMTARQFREQMKARRDAALTALDDEKRRALIRQSALIDKAKADMIERHNQEREKMREAWRQFYASRESAAPGRTYRTRKPQPLPVKDHHPMKDKFDAASMAAAKQAAARVPTDDYRLSTPAPAPRPAGIVDP